MHRIFIVDDETRIRDVIKEYAEFKGNSVAEAYDGVGDVVNLCRTQDFDVKVMDVMMPKLDGFLACKETMKRINIPVVMLQGDEEYDKLFGLEIGIDDYVVKPFSPKELVARISVIVCRNLNKEATRIDSEKLRLHGLEVDLVGRNVYVNGEKADLTPKEYDLLSYFVKNRNIALSRDKLLSDVWGSDYKGSVRTLDTHIKMLRNKLGKYQDYIVTLWGVGYKFQAEES